jgi:pimeloyl-ACP methyl ester carboxylesterase
MPDHRRAAFASALPPNLHEWDAATDPQLCLDDLVACPAPTLLITDPDTRRPILGLARLLEAARPDWRSHPLPGGGHMAPLVRPDLVNPVVSAFLDDTHP